MAAAPCAICLSPIQKLAPAINAAANSNEYLGKFEVIGAR